MEISGRQLGMSWECRQSSLGSKWKFGSHQNVDGVRSLYTVKKRQTNLMTLEAL